MPHDVPRAYHPAVADLSFGAFVAAAVRLGRTDDGQPHDLRIERETLTRRHARRPA